MFKVFNHNHTTKLYKTFNHLRLTRNTSPSKQILPASKSENICQDLIDSRADLVMSSLNRLHNRHQVTSNKHCSIRSRSIEFIRAVRSLQYNTEHCTDCSDHNCVLPLQSAVMRYKVDICMLLILRLQVWAPAMCVGAYSSSLAITIQIFF